MVFLVVHPRPCEIAVAVDPSICHIRGNAQLLLEPVEIVVGDKLGLTVRNAPVSGRMEITVVQVDIVKSQVVPQWMDMHLADTLRIVSGFGELTRHRVGIVPWDIVLISDPSVMALLHSCVQRGSCGNAARTCAVRMIEDHAFRGERVKIRRLYIRMAGIAEAVPAELICHDQNNIRLFHSVYHSLLSYL